MAMLRYILFVSVISLLIYVPACDMTEEKESKGDHVEGPDLVELNNEIHKAILANDFNRVDTLVDLVLNEAEKRGDHRAYIDAKTHQVSAFFDRNRINEASELIKENLERIESHGTPRQEVAALIQLSNIYFFQNRDREGLEVLSDAERLSPDVDDKNIVATVYASKGRAVSRHDPVESLRLNIRALEKFKEIGDKRNEAVTRNNIALIYHRQDKNEMALQEYDHAIRLNRETGNKLQLATNYNNIANSLRAIDRKEEAADSLLKAVDINQQMGISPRLIQNYYNLAEVYTDLEKYDLAYSYFSQAYEESRSINFQPGIMYHSIGLANVLMETGDLNQVQQFLNESRQLAIQLNNLDVLARSWDLEASLMERQQNYSGALDAKRQMQAYSDSLDSIRREREFEEVRMAYEVDLKSAENELLRQELSYQERLSSNQRMLLAGLIIGVVIFAGFLLVLFRNQWKLRKAYKSMEQKNKVITAKNNQLRSLNSELKQINNEKDRLVDIIVHDLRNPLFGVIGFLDVINENIKDETDKEHLNIARKSAHRLNNMISGLLEVHSLEKEPDSVELVPVQCDDLVANVVDSYREVAREKEIRITKHLKPLQVESNRTYLERIADNLISNALKFSPKKSEIAVQLKSAGNDCWQFIVSDHGPGISIEDQKKMFQMFSKLSARPTGDEQTTGLGLYTVKMLIERLGGTISVESEVGEGSSFICEFPRGFAGLDIKQSDEVAETSTNGEPVTAEQDQVPETEYHQ